MKYRDLIKKIKAIGWVHERTKGSHMQFGHPNRIGKVTVPGGGKMNRDVPPGTLKSILKQAGIQDDGT
jgi:predicted RNA binding protein YcfA (HicA-like mRNA interferase family)